MSLRFPPCGVYAITDCSRLSAAALLQKTRALLPGGIAALQYRDKDKQATHNLDSARVLRALCRRARIPFLVNDDLALAQAIRADGIHLGRDDASPEQARAALGEAAIIGLSCYNDIQRARAAAAHGVDYVALGAFYPSSSKARTAPAEPALLSAVRRESALPIVAIGGITPDNGGRLLDAGADLLAVIAGLYHAPSPGAALAAYQRLFAGRG